MRVNCHRTAGNSSNEDNQQPSLEEEIALYTVYRVENQVNGKSYIGITSRDAGVRWLEHLSRTNCNSRRNRLYQAIRKYGSDKFELSVLYSCHSEDKVRELEKHYIEKHDSYNNGYNCNLGGCGHLHLPEDLRKKIGDAQKGKTISYECRHKMSIAKLGKSEYAENFGDYTKKGSNNPRSKAYLIQFPDGHIEVVVGIRAFCRNNKIMYCKLNAGTMKTKGFHLLKRLNDHPEREYAQAGGSGGYPGLQGKDMVCSA